MNEIVINSLIGKLILEEVNGKLTKCLPTKKKLTKKNTSPILKEAQIAIEKYFAGDKSSLKKIPIKLNGTDFQNQVWKEIKKIQFSKTKSYSELAKAINKEKAVRAVGTGCGRNSLLLFIPCHRVLAKNNKLGGFSAGTEKKKFLLEHEKATHS